MRKVPPRRRKKKEEKWHWSLTFLLLSWFVGMPFILGHAVGTTTVGFGPILLTILGVGSLSLLIQTPIFAAMRKKGGGERYVVGKQLFVLYNILGCGVAGCALMLQLNYSFRSDELIVEEYEMIKIDPDYRPGAYSGIVFILEGGKFEDDVDLRWFNVIAKHKRRKQPFVRYTYNNGLFGFVIMQERYFVTGPDDKSPTEMPYL